MDIPKPASSPVIEGQIVTMPPRLMWQCEMWGFERHVTAINEGKRERTKSGRDPVAVHIDGVRGEVAFHWWLTGTGFVPTNGTYKQQADIGDDLEVRCRIRNPGQWHNVDLIIRPDDDPNKRYVLVINDRVRNFCAFDIAGWIWGHEARQYKLENHGKWGKAWFVKVDQLRPMESLEMSA